MGESGADISYIVIRASMMPFSPAGVFTSSARKLAASSEEHRVQLLSKARESAFSSDLSEGENKLCTAFMSPSRERYDSARFCAWMTAWFRFTVCVLSRCDFANSWIQTALAREKNRIAMIISIKNKLDLECFMISSESFLFGDYSVVLQ